MSSIVIDLVNQRFGKLLVIEQSGRDKWGQVLWLCKCDCGNEKIITSGNLRRPQGNVSCGCEKAVRFRNTYTKHGQSKSKEYRKNLDFLKRFRKYGITEVEFNQLLEKQDHRCAICGVVPDSSTSRSRDGFHIDHSHVTGRIRGLLCGNCNTGIGMLKDSEKVLQSAIEYLRRTE